MVVVTVIIIIVPVRATCTRSIVTIIAIIAGTLLEIGQGKRLPEEMTAILHSENREQSGKTAPACGLYLERVFYEKKEAGL